MRERLGHDLDGVWSVVDGGQDSTCCLERDWTGTGLDERTIRMQRDGFGKPLLFFGVFSEESNAGERRRHAERRHEV
jgi:hypothetical protein